MCKVKKKRKIFYLQVMRSNISWEGTPNIIGENLETMLRAMLKLRAHSVYTFAHAVPRLSSGHVFVFVITDIPINSTVL